MNSILQLSWPLAINRHLMRQSRHKGKVCVSWNDWMCEEAQPNTAFSKQNTVPPRDPEHTPRTAPRATARLCWAGLCCWGAFLSKGGLRDSIPLLLTFPVSTPRLSYPSLRVCPVSCERVFRGFLPIAPHICWALHKILLQVSPVTAQHHPRLEQ